MSGVLPVPERVGSSVSVKCRLGPDRNLDHIRPGGQVWKLRYYRTLHTYLLVFWKVPGPGRTSTELLRSPLSTDYEERGQEGPPRLRPDLVTPHSLRSLPTGWKDRGTGRGGEVTTDNLRSLC